MRFPAPVKMTPERIRMAVLFASEEAGTAQEAFDALPQGLVDVLPDGWDEARLFALCGASVAPEGTEPALCAYRCREDVFGDNTTAPARSGFLARGSMLVTRRTVVRRYGLLSIRIRRQRIGLVVTLEPEGLEVLWSPWTQERSIV